MLRRTFLRRMALAAAACAFIDVPWPKATTWEPIDEWRDGGFYGRSLLDDPLRRRLQEIHTDNLRRMLDTYSRLRTERRYVP